MILEKGTYKTKKGYTVTLHSSFIDPKTEQTIWYGSRPMQAMLYYLPDGKLDTVRNGTDSQNYTLVEKIG